MNWLLLKWNESMKILKCFLCYIIHSDFIPLSLFISSCFIPTPYLWLLLKGYKNFDFWEQIVLIVPKMGSTLSICVMKKYSHFVKWYDLL